jgi:hypothetical protein
MRRLVLGLALYAACVLATCGPDDGQSDCATRKGEYSGKSTCNWENPPAASAAENSHLCLIDQWAATPNTANWSTAGAAPCSSCTELPSLLNPKPATASVEWAKDKQGEMVNRRVSDPLSALSLAGHGAGHHTASYARSTVALTTGARTVVEVWGYKKTKINTFNENHLHNIGKRYVQPGGVTAFHARGNGGTHTKRWHCQVRFANEKMACTTTATAPSSICTADVHAHAHE